MDFPSGSVDDFLRKVRGAKNKQREAVEENLEPLLSDPAVFVVAPEMGKLIDKELETYGDEALKQIAMVVIGKWLAIHQDVGSQHARNDDLPGALLAQADATKLGVVLRIMEEIGSFGGDEEYRKAMRGQINQAVMEGIEESGLLPEEFFQQ